MSGLDLYLDQRALLRMLWVALCAGVASGILFDLFSVLRDLFGITTQDSEGTVRRCIRSAVVFIEDALFAVSVTIIFLLVCYYTSDGQVRSPAVLGMIGGFGAYRAFVSRFVLCILRWGVQKVHGVIRLLVSLTRSVLVFLYKKVAVQLLFHPIRCLLRWGYGHTIGRLAARRRDRYTRSKTAEMITDAAHGFEFGKTDDPSLASFENQKESA